MEEPRRTSDRVQKECFSIRVGFQVARFPRSARFLLISLARSVTIKTLRCYSTIFHGVPRYSAPYSTPAEWFVVCAPALVKLRSDWRSFFDPNRLSFVQIREVSSSTRFDSIPNPCKSNILFGIEGSTSFLCALKLRDFRNDSLYLRMFPTEIKWFREQRQFVRLLFF
ncbi:hypothetical protein QLX08_004561 [Tetragonisca angustula]|uniref:Uncharacterized protein n=1 Tax=Tetragonisca angustula TaxID=166442 RepID=A0AAW1A1M1_9HYME